ncbi:MAG TPA: XdhC family protein [Burkholderiaceae bacterium]|nr:XdhC family protein [Burkholderiaceae bacterium]
MRVPAIFGAAPGGAAFEMGRPLDLDSDQIFRQIRQWLGLGRGVALATVVQTWGSSPRPPGSHLAVDSTGQFMGSVSGGCIEASVIHEAQVVIRDGRPRRLKFGVSDEQAWEVGLACGGQVEVYLERIE